MKVSFFLLAYNQEQYIREACLAALAQDYAELEIVFSDDCSTDKTFEVMEAVANAYQGPHKVILNRNIQNLDLIEHINLSNQISSGDLIVVAAGDDISLPHRVSKIVQTYLSFEGRANCIHSNVMKIDRSGQALGLSTPPLADKRLSLAEMTLTMSLIIGATHAWTREVFNRFGPIAQTNAYEDLVLAYRSALIGEIAYIGEPLVHYRVGEVSISNWVAATTPEAIQTHLLKELRLTLAVYRQRLADCRIVGRSDLTQLLTSAIIEARYRRLLVHRNFSFWRLLPTAMRRGELSTLLAARRHHRRFLRGIRKAKHSSE